MADNYTMFSEQLDKLSDEEMAWLEKRVASYEEADNETNADERIIDFDYKLDRDERTFWVYSEEQGSPDSAANFIQEFLKENRPGDVFYIGFAWTCSRPRIGEFGGGKLRVTSTQIKGCVGDCLRKGMKKTCVNG